MVFKMAMGSIFWWPPDKRQSEGKKLCFSPACLRVLLVLSSTLLLSFCSCYIPSLLWEHSVSVFKYRLKTSGSREVFQVFCARMRLLSTYPHGPSRYHFRYGMSIVPICYWWVRTWEKRLAVPNTLSIEFFSRYIPQKK